MKDVADHAGVSIRTVSNVVNDFPYVSDDMRRKVQASLDHLGYSINTVARGLRSGRTGTIALVVPQLAEPYFAELAQAVIRAAANHGLTVLVETTEDPKMQTEILRGALNPIADGVLLSATVASISQRADVPLVLLGEHRPTQFGHYVGLDNIAAARTVVRHLHEQGCTRIAALGIGKSATATQRYKAYKAELRARNIAAVEGLAIGTDDWSPSGGHAAVEQLLAAVHPVRRDLRLQRLVGLRRDPRSEDGRRAIPDDVAVAGMDNLVQSEYMDPPLTSLAPDIGALADTAVALLVDQIEQRRGDTSDYERVLTPFDLRVRASTLRSSATAAPA